MDVSAGPAALGGIMLGVALGAWTLGRWQGGLVVVEDASVPTPGAATPAVTTPCRNAVRAECAAAPLAEDSLGEMHAEISAYRRAEQVLAGFDAAGQPTGSTIETARAVQPSPSVPDLARV